MIQGISLARVAGMYAMDGWHNPFNARHWASAAGAMCLRHLLAVNGTVAPVRMIAYNAMVHCTNARFFTRLS
jgi:hypothetical protein